MNLGNFFLRPVNTTSKVVLAHVSLFIILFVIYSLSEKNRTATINMTQLHQFTTFC